MSYQLDLNPDCASASSSSALVELSVKDHLEHDLAGTADQVILLA